MRLLRRNLAPYLSLPADQFSKADLRAARDAMVEADAMHRRQPPARQRSGPVLKWAAQEDLIPANFVPDIRTAPEEKRSRKLTEAEIKAIWNACGNLGSTRSGKELRSHGAIPTADGAAPRRGRIASPWPHPRWRVAADREQGSTGRTASHCRRWR